MTQKAKEIVNLQINTSIAPLPSNILFSAPHLAQIEHKKKSLLKI